MRRHSRGFSLVELMVAVTLAAITGIVVLTVLSNYQGRKQTTVGRNDAEINASLGLFSVEKEVRMAGSGMTLPTGMFCNLGINIAYNGVTISDAAPLRPIRIVDGGAGVPDQIDILRSNSEFGSAPSSVLQLMASAASAISVDGSVGLTNGDLILVGASDGNKICTLMQMSAAPVANGTNWNLPHASGAAPYNPADPSTVFTTPVAYDVRDLVVNMGRQGWRRFAVVCNDGAAPSATNNCDLASYNLLAAPNPPTLADVQSESAQIIELQAQYGIAAAGTQNVNAWVDATGAWAAPTEADQRRIKAIRIAIVARGTREGTMVTPATITLWGGVTRAMSNAERRYRYQVLTVVIPLINTIWAGV